ncbi:MAG: hypothetical protein AAF902_12245 [Chloroflexota bacterium]
MQTAVDWVENQEKWYVRTLFENLWKTSPLITGVILAHVLLIGVCLVGLGVDDRTLLGEPTWIKPLKFAISGAVYCGTIGWMMTFATKAKWIAKCIAGGNGILMAGEVGIVTLQASRGLRSHYNLSTPLDAALWQTMGMLIMLMWMLNLLFIFYLMFQPMKDFAFKSALIWGVIIGFCGGLTGFAMTEQHTPAQAEILEQGGSLDYSGGHTIGAEDGGPGLPFVGWSTTHGDVRPAHFFGLHGLQLIPLLGLFINSRWGHLSGRRRTVLVFTGSMAYLSFVYVLLQQALNGLPIIGFDLRTMLSLITITVTYGALWGWLTKWQVGAKLKFSSLNSSQRS